MMKRLLTFMVLLTVAMTAANAALPSRSGDGANNFEVVWSGDLTTTYTATPYTGLTATYFDALGFEQNTTLTFVNGSEVFVSPNYPTNAGVYTVTATPIVAGDTLDPATATVTLTILPAKVSAENCVIVTTKFYDGNNVAEVLNIGVLTGILGNDNLTHTVEAHYDTPNVGSEKDITITYSLFGTSVANYQFRNPQKVIHNGAILEDMRPDTSYGGHGINEGIEVEAYGYCSGSGSIEYHLVSGNPDQYRIIFDNPAMPDVNWTNISTPGQTGTININIPAGIATGDYTGTLSFRDHNYPTLISPGIRVSFHVNLPETYVMPLFNDVIALVDTCHCLTDIQWYHRETGAAQWDAIDGANDYYYRQEGGLTGEYFVSCKMNGVDTYTCPQDDVETLYGSQAQVKVAPNPVQNTAVVTIENSELTNHDMRITNFMGQEVERGSFEGDHTTINMDGYMSGNYIITVDGIAVKVMKK